MRFSYFDRRTGLFTGKQITVNKREQLRAVDPNIDCIEGAYDPMSERVVIHRTTDKETGKDIEAFDVIDYQPPKPNDSSEWDDDKKRWQLTAEAQRIDDLHEAANAEIAKLEASQARSMRELALDPNNQEAKRYLISIDLRIAELRANLKR